MLKQIIAIWKGDKFMKKIVESFGEMISDGEKVFRDAWEAVAGDIGVKDIRQQIYDRDRRINDREREIRRMLAEHLSINPRQDTAGSLAMMSLVKDAERIGDYAKNIFELAFIMGKDIREMKYIDRLTALKDRIADRFPPLKKSYVESDEELAREVLNEYQDIKLECGKLMDELFVDELPTREAICTVLMIRSLKRINSHMSNIASGIIYPLDQIDFVREKGGILD
ncbi:MAG TPA: PhoU domain-containing protein [Candidatus Krumholzibacterium sp.]|nr:PhoU domain-containing protein [Candidatus Krumholzibacterium sp.]